MTFIIVLATAVFAKTHRTEIIAVDTIEYTLEEEDKLSAELWIEEDGLYDVRPVSLSTSGKFAPKISIKIFNGNTEIYSFVTGKKRDFEGTEPESYGFTFGLSEGEYRVEIENLTKFSDVTFRIETTFTEEENIEDFGNTGFESASEIATNEKYFGCAVMYDEVDYFTFEMPYDGVAYIQMYSPDAKFFTLYDENKNEIGSIGIKIEEADKIYELRSGLAKGRYYITVQPDEDYCLPAYTLKVETAKGDNFEKEYNNDKSIAMDIESGKEYQGNLFGIHDLDYYTFTLSEKSEVTLDFTDTIASKDGHYAFSLTDGEKVIYSCDEAGRITKTLSLEKGKYFFMVKISDSDLFTSMIYKIKVSSDKGFAKETEDAVPEDTVEETIQFDDVNESDWYASELLEAKSLGLIEGIGDNNFNPKGTITLAEVITMAVRVKNMFGGVNTEITNSPVGKWYNSYITFAVNSGIFKMGDFDDFERNATREEVAYIFANVLDDIELNEKTTISDVDENTKYGDSIYKLYTLGILKGDGDGKFRPNDSITRAETAAILLRVCENS